MPKQKLQSFSFPLPAPFTPSLCSFRGTYVVSQWVSFIFWMNGKPGISCTCLTAMVYSCQKGGDTHKKKSLYNCFGLTITKHKESHLTSYLHSSLLNFSSLDKVTPSYLVDNKLPDIGPRGKCSSSVPSKNITKTLPHLLWQVEAR